MSLIVENGFHIAYDDAGVEVSRERVLDDQPNADSSAFFSELAETPEWKVLSEKFDLTDETNLAVVASVVAGIPGKTLISVAQAALRKIALAGGVTKFGAMIPRPIEQPAPVVEEPEVPRDKNGQPLSSAQLAWGEMTRWSLTASSREIAERRRCDPAYASFYRKNLERETNVPVGDAVTDLNAPGRRNEGSVSDLVRRFAKLHRELPADRLKARGGFITLGEDMRFTKIQFDDLVARATAAGLLN